MSTDAPATVHIVDDDDALRAALARLLSAAGNATRGYTSAGAFFIEADGPPTGCLLLDLHMPGPDGLALQDALRRRGIHLPTVFLSGRGDIARCGRALKGGASDFLTKPVQAEVLLKALRQAFDADAPRRAQRERLRLQSQRLAALSPRERAVLAMVVPGTLPALVRLSAGVADPSHPDTTA